VYRGKGRQYDCTSKDVADLMGHSSVTTTEIYLHRDVTELAQSQDRLPQVWDDAGAVAAG
jgi:site-specific recombinase XerC